MNTKFNILWFEDTDEWYEPARQSLEDYIKALHFLPIFIREKSIIEDELKKKIDNTNFDLIIADLNLSDGTTGKQAIEIIRANDVLADILFYSNDGKDKISDIIRTEIFEGVYLSLRDEFVFDEKAKKLINKTIRRAEDILNIRGMLMDSVSDFDARMRECICAFLSKYPKKHQELDEFAYDLVHGHLEKNIREINCNKLDFISKTIKSSYLLDSNKLSRIIHKIFNEYLKNDSMVDFHNQYSTFILKERNSLAHIKKENGNDGFYFRDNDGKDVQYDSEKCKQIRGNLIKYDELLKEVFQNV